MLANFGCPLCVHWTTLEITCPSLEDLSWISYWKCASTVLSISNPDQWVVWPSHNDTFLYHFKWQKLFVFQMQSKGQNTAQIAGVNLGQKEAESCYRKVKLCLISHEYSSAQSFSWIISFLSFHLKASVPVICCLCPPPVLPKAGKSSSRTGSKSGSPPPGSWTLLLLVPLELYM